MKPRPPRGRAPIAGVLAALAVAAGGVDAQRVTYSGGASYSAGSYVFDTRSNTFFFANGLRMDVGALDFGASIPIMVYNGGLVTRVASGVTLPTGGSQSGLVAGRSPGETLGTRKGRRAPDPDSVAAPDSVLVFVDGYRTDLGDPYLSMNGQVYSGLGTVRSVSLSGSAKVPVSDPETGAGSGEWDVGAGASVIFGVGRTLLLADVSYLWLGDMPDLELRDGLSYAIGASLPAFSGAGSVLLLLSGMSETIASMDPPVSLSASLSRSVGDRTFLSVGLGVGLTESAADFSLNVGWSVRLAGR